MARPALWFCASNLLATVVAAQCTNVSQVPNQTISSGTSCYSNNDTLTAAGVIINGSASVTFVAGHTVHLTPGFHATAGTAGTTFHAWVEAAPSVISVFPSSGSGTSQQFTWAASSPSGYANIAEVYAIFNTSVSGANGCYLRYSRAANTLFLANDAGTAWNGGFNPGSSSSASNSYCTLYGAGSSINASGNQLSVTVNVAFQPSTFSGTKNSYLNVYDNEGLYTGWQQMGTWTVESGGSFTPIRISSGGPYTDSQGQVWAGDYGYLQSLGTWSTTAAISNTLDPALYQTERFNYPGSLTYQFGVPNGNYTVTLKFAEIYDTAPGQRYMNIALNGATVVTGLDVWTAAGGPNRAYDLSFPVSVSNGQLTISLTCTSPNNSAEVNAIQIVSGGSQQQYYLTTAVSPSGGGTISPASGWYNSGSPVTIAATPASGYVFTGFSGDLNGTTNPHAVTVNGPIMATAAFVAATTPDFSLNLPSAVTVEAGFQSSFPLSMTPQGGFNSAVTWTVTPSASGVSAIWAANSQAAPLPSGATATLSAAASAAQGTFQVTVSATGGGISHTGTIFVTISPPWRAQSETNMGPISLLEYDDQHGLG
ncbi:MAG: malectin, partial [Acidobacteriota bacterium]|nr:malectin [Acidobacteriota bacterium]